MRLIVAAAFVALTTPAAADNLDALVAKHAAVNGVPEQLVRRVIKIESRGNPGLSNAGNFGLMQIRLGTAKAMGYSGDAKGLLDADTNMTYAVRYLAGAYRAAGGNHDRAVHYYQRGYYDVAKTKGFSPYQTASAPVVTSEKTTALFDKPVATTAEKPAAMKMAKVESRPFNLLSYLSYYGTPDTPAGKKRKVQSPAAKTTTAIPAATTAVATTPSAQKP